MSGEFLGYPRSFGGAGTRDYVAVVASVICSTTPVREIAARVPGAIAIAHEYGCSQVGDDLGQTRRTLAGVAANPNVSAALLVGLGCETNQADALAQVVPVKKPLAVIGVQALGGSESTIDKGVSIVQEFLRQCPVRREPVPLSDLCVGVVVGDDDGSVETMSPVVGATVDRLVDAGATVIVGLNDKLAPAGGALARRATGAAAEALAVVGQGLHRKRWMSDESRSNETRAWSSQEKAAALARTPATGTSPIQSVLAYAQRPDCAGLHLMKLTSNVVEAFGGLVAGGVNLILVVSRRGLFTGVIGCPTMVAAPAHGQGNAWSELVDHIVGDEGAPIESARLLDSIVAVASGRATAVEREELLAFGITRVGTPF